MDRRRRRGARRRDRARAARAELARVPHPDQRPAAALERPARRRRPLARHPRLPDPRPHAARRRPRRARLRRPPRRRAHRLRPVVRVQDSRVGQPHRHLRPLGGPRPRHRPAPRRPRYRLRLGQIPHRDPARRPHGVPGQGRRVRQLTLGQIGGAAETTRHPSRNTSPIVPATMAASSHDSRRARSGSPSMRARTSGFTENERAASNRYSTRRASRTRPST